MGYLSDLFGFGARLVNLPPAGFGTSGATGSSHGPESPSSDALCMVQPWQIISDVVAGHDQVKMRGEKYLCRFESESIQKYRRRLLDAPWRPIFNAAVESITSRPFRNPVSLGGEVSPKIDVFSQDVDSCGNNLNVFARRFFNASVTYGVGALFVDYTRVVQPTDGNALTLADERGMNARPFWVLIQPQDLIAVRTTRVNGREVYSHVRWSECETVPIGAFGESVVERVRVVELDAAGKPYWTLYECDAGGDYVEVASGEITIPEIPLVLFFTGQKEHGTFAVKPPLYDLAIMALEYYRSLARATEIQTFSGWPTLVGKGLSKDGGDELTVGPGITLYAPGDTADWHIIGPDAALVEQVNTGPDEVLQAFNSLAMQPQVPKSGNVTATASALDNSKAHSAVEAWSYGLKDALDQALHYTAMWFNESDTATAVVSTDFDAAIGSADEAKVLASAQQRGVISGETERGELKRRGILSPDFEEEQELMRIASEQQGLQPEFTIHPTTGEPIDPAGASFGASPPPDEGVRRTLRAYQ
jgi:hypothetical protein